MESESSVEDPLEQAKSASSPWRHRRKKNRQSLQVG